MIMKAKYILLIAALAGLFAGCEKQEPFDTQSPDDDPLILKPYNESGTGSFTYNLANPDTPLFDSVVVTPSDYTTVNWYIDDELVYTGNKIEMCFPAGHYDLLIEAVTVQDKRTTRSGSVTVQPYANDPYAAAPNGGRHLVPGVEMTVEGNNLAEVAEVVIARDFYGNDVVCTVNPTYQEAGLIKFILPDMADGTYYLFFQNQPGNRYGSDKIQVHNGAVVLDGYQEFVPQQEWVITGVNLQDVASVKLDETVITDIVATAVSVTFTAPAAEEGKHTLSMTTKDGSAVMFVTSAGIVTQVQTAVSGETTLWTGPEYLQWSENRVRVESDVMATVPEGSTILIYYEKLPAGHEGYYEGTEYKEYQKMKVMTAWWTDLFPEFDVTDDTPNPYTFVYSADMKALAESQNAMCIAGWGLNINKITFK